MGKNNETFDGLVVLRNSSYEFYPGVKDCGRRGTPYWIVPNGNFYDVVEASVHVNSIEELFRLHRAWRVKLRGNLSRIGRYGYEGRYWRELSPIYVIDAMSLDCKKLFNEQP